MPRRDDQRDDDRDDVKRRPRDKKPSSGPWLWIGLGCGCFFLLGTAALVAAIVIGISFWPGGPAGVGGPDIGGPGIVGPPAPPGVPPSPKITQMPGLIAYWSFDEIQSNSVIDHSSKGNHLKVVGGRIDRGQRGNALWLDGPANHYCQIPSTADFNFPDKSGFTFAGWVKTSLQAGVIISLTSSTGPQQIDLILRDNKFLVVVGDNNDRGNTQNAFVWSKNTNDGQWHHLVAIRRGSMVQLWLDGVQQGQMAAGHSGGAVTTDQGALGSERGWILTNDKRWGNPSFQGGIDEVCVFNRAIEPAEIQTLLEAGR